MGNFFDRITDEQAALIAAAPVFFVASTAPQPAWSEDGAGPVNVSPKGGTPLHIVSPNRVVWLDYPGSGNETARHAALGGLVTVMVCSFEAADAAIVRLFGRATATPAAESSWTSRLIESSTISMKTPRQVIEVEVERTQTSCGYGVPVMNLDHSRTMAERGRRYKPPR